jgi:hypothetical protein
MIFLLFITAISTKNICLKTFSKMVDMYTSIEELMCPF